MLSMRYDFPDAWAKLQQTGQASVAVTESHIPFFMSARLDTTPFDVLVEPGSAYPTVEFDGQAGDQDMVGLDGRSGLWLLARTTPVNFVKSHTITVTTTGGAGDAIKDLYLRVVLRKL